jgi:hypothetical protein
MKVSGKAMKLALHRAHELERVAKVDLGRGNDQAVWRVEI